ncbi:MAG TPA: hypothetical protein VFI60_08370 [Candidatus Acidoferrum sp.]|jgi:hypothetical protein|nr:hypothetical protein [Candidatus Acidoferrum sp.]
MGTDTISSSHDSAGITIWLDDKMQANNPEIVYRLMHRGLSVCAKENSPDAAQGLVAPFSSVTTSIAAEFPWPDRTKRI